jgi:hypothetical protein
LAKSCSDNIVIKRITMSSASPFAVSADISEIDGYTQEFCVACRGENGTGAWKYQDNISFTQRLD